jgi:sugar phosphate permease
VRLLSENLAHEDYVLGNAMVTCAAHSATMILYLFVPACLQFFNWQTVFFVAATLAVIVFFVFVFGLRRVLPEHPHAATKLFPKAKEKKQSYFSLLAAAGVIPLLLSVALQGYLRDGIDSWLPTLFSELFAVEAAGSTLLSVILPIFAIFSMFLSLKLHRRLLKNEALGTGVLFGFSSLFALLLYFLIGTKGVFAGILTLLLAALITTCAHCCNFFLISCLPGHFARYGRAATTSGFCNAFTYLGSAASSSGIALIATYFDWRANVLSWVLLSTVGVLCSVLAYRRYTRFFRESENFEKEEDRETANAAR